MSDESLWVNYGRCLRFEGFFGVPVVFLVEQPSDFAIFTRHSLSITASFMATYITD
jgi:hypothetical protein